MVAPASLHRSRIPGNDQVPGGNRRLPGTAQSQSGQRRNLRVTPSHSRIHEDRLRRIDNQSRTLDDIPNLELVQQVDGYFLARSLERAGARHIDALMVVDLLRA
jgi:hypothetical protein